MQFDNQKTRNVADIAAKIMAGETVEKVEQPKMLEEELKGNQHKIDANKNGKVDADDFAKLRAQKEKEKSNSMKFGKDVKEETEQEEPILEYESKDGRFVHKAKLPVGVQYGATVWKKDKLDKPGPTKSDLQKIERENKKKKFSEMIENYKQNGLKTISEWVEKETISEEPTNDEYTSELKDQKEKSEGKKKQPELSKGNVQAVKQEEVEQIDELNKDTYKNYLSTSKKLVGDHAKGSQLSRYGEYGAKDRELNTKNAQKHAMKKLKEEEVEQVDEREMTDAEMKKREDIVKGMKKGMAGFKQRYGERAKSVMYATATKQAMKEENDEESV